MCRWAFGSNKELSATSAAGDHLDQSQVYLVATIHINTDMCRLLRACRSRILGVLQSRPSESK